MGIFTVKNENNVSLGIDMDLSKKWIHRDGKGYSGSTIWEPDPIMSGPKSYGENFKKNTKR